MPQGRDMLGDTPDNAPELRQQCHRRGGALGGTRHRPSPRRERERRKLHDPALIMTTDLAHVL